MKLRLSTSLFLAIIIILSSTIPVNASPVPQNTGESIMEALNATAQELGLSDHAEILSEDGVTYWALNPPLDVGSTTILVVQTDLFFLAMVEYVGLFGGSATPVSFYGYTAYSISSILFVNNINGYYLAFQDSGETIAGAKAVAEVFFRHAAASGFIDGSGSGTGQDGSGGTETVTPELTITPEVGVPIKLRAYAENYDQVTEYIDNSDNFDSVDISGRVIDLDTTEPIEGATIEITSGAASSSTVSAADGSYSLTAVVSGGEGSGLVQDVDFALPLNADLSIEVSPDSRELLADGTSTSLITIQVKDLQGNPLKDRVLDLTVLADAGPGTIQPGQATTDENGLIQATYTAFKLEPGQRSDTSRHEVTISARDTATGLAGTNWIYVNQYQLSVQNNEYILACAQCSFPSEFTIFVTDYWNNPVPNTPLTLQIEGGNSGGTLVIDPNSNTSQQEISLTTDSSGQATAYYRWQGNQNITETIQKVTVIEGVTNTQMTKNVKVQGIDISLARVEEAGFTGVTGQQAFLKVYFKERIHPDLPLDRFNTTSPNKLGLRVTISQYHSDGVNTSVTYENYGGWEEDEGGLFVKMYDTPHMPYIIPVNDGNSWYEIRVDPVTDHDIDLPDQFRPNNDTILVLKTGSPAGWLHIWLQDGILTPHNWAGVVFKCVGRFLPGVGQAMTVIDTLNQTFILDALSLGQSTTQVVTEALENKSTLLTPANNALDLTRTAAFTNIISCIQDIYSVSKAGSAQVSLISSGGNRCASLVRPLQNLLPFPALDENESEQISIYQDRFAHGLLLDSPDERGLVIYGLEASEVTLRDASGIVFDDPDRMDVEDRVAIYILPVNEIFQLETASDHAFEIAIYEAGSDVTNRITIRHNVQTDTPLMAKMAIGGTSEYDLELDYDNDGVFDDSLSAQVTILDVVKPQITGLYPEDIIPSTEEDLYVFASYADNPDGAGIDVGAIKIFLDGIDLTSDAFVQPDILSVSLSDLQPGEHSVRLVVSDLDGNAAVAEWSFIMEGEASIMEGESSPASGIKDFILVNGIGVFFILLVGTVLAFSFRRRQRRAQHQLSPRKNQPTDQADAVQDQQGSWWHQDPDTEIWRIWNGESWQAAETEPELLPPPSQPEESKSRGRGCLFSVLTTLIMSLVVFGGVALVTFDYFPILTINPASTVSVPALLKNGGAGLLIASVGALLLSRGFNSITSRRVSEEDESGRKREKRGCLAVLYGIVCVFLGLITLFAGLAWIAVTVYQQVAPLLGWVIV